MLPLQRRSLTKIGAWTTALIVLSFATPTFSSDAVGEVGSQNIHYNDQIRPILSKHCIACHGPDEGDRQAGLRLDTYEGATEDFGGYAALKPGDAEASEMIIRIVSDDPDQRMPPPDHAEALSASEIDLLRRWIASGGRYQSHWSFAALRRPEIPSVETGTARNHIDPFILRKVNDSGLKQNPTTDPRSLVRRICLDLTGLPPVSHGEKVQASISDYLAQPSQQTLSRLVDDLLSSGAYAEHWAAVWMDIARYADTVGYSGDERRDIWPWRDWLIRSLQANKSYKDLSIEMLAGDLLPGATEQQRLATAFHRNTLSNNEGGTNDEEFRTIAIKDRLSTTMNAWMGLTVRCAECHSHKYDPISHLEYYQLLDFFNQSVDADRKDERPKLAIQAKPDPTVTKKINQQIESLREKLKASEQVWFVQKPEKMESLEGTQFELLADESILAKGPNPDREEYAFTFDLPVGETIRAIRLEAIPHILHDGHTGRAPEGAFILSQIRLVRHEGEKEEVLPFADAENDFNQVNHHAKTAIKAKVDSGAPKQGWAVNHPVDGYKGHREAVFELKEPLIGDENTSYTIHLLHDPPWPRLNLGCVRVSTCSVAEAASEYRKKKLDPLNRQIAQLIIDRDAPVRVPVMEELPPDRRRQTFVMLRGNFQSPDEKVSAKFPDAFPLPSEKADEIAMNRLGLAYWLFDEENPLTARVAVNRYWSRLMGIGLVETEEDFGTQGTPPSHPDLLDYLAVEFRDGGWDVQRLLKMIVMSATYQQSQAVTPKSVEVDPRNRLLARGPRTRLAAEVVRDQALAVSGLLSTKMYGAPVYPPSPIKRVVNAFTGGMTWQESEGDDRHRRALYTFLKRSAPHPLFETFDMASRDTCSMRRLRTNTPLQSFMTLNDVTFIEAARALADQMIECSETAKYPKEGAQIRGEISFGLNKALYSQAEEHQLRVLEKLYRSSVDRYSSDRQAAAELTGEDKNDFDPSKLSEADSAQLCHRAAMTVVANVILNLDGFLNN